MEHLGGCVTATGVETRLVRVERPMNDHDAMTVRVVQTGELRTLVGYETPELRDRLEVLSEGSEFPIRLSPSRGRGNSWVALKR
ncbi:hypothetical protein C440_00170 [Haloferax mucosum ATCC BAA-1512]|uniref:DUF7999 domain-containing protein n=1 Tax=Haloferax mucosum ATCC BAA-1512 TaxID=662479 RepID=M0ITA6_9EURY|nr:hypothetical protein [Haloferax mucosum]ELZ98724.1 hypothetical protein C440_00170 [Haloferax mucosum ATCC BAA-1512]